MEMDPAIRVQIIDEDIRISYVCNSLRKGMNPITLPPATGKIEVKTGL